LRAGLLSDPEVISRLNKDFVCTSVIIDDVQKQAQSGDALAKQLADWWEYPVEMMFLSPSSASPAACTLVSKLNSFKDFPGVHRDVVAPPKTQHVGREDDRSHRDIFLKHLAVHFGTY
jgi:hypothetical protein